ncbi:MAG: TIM-barrel domain-containing protein, partial [Kiritimatiellia bacterium]
MSNPPPSPPPRQEGSALIWTSRHETLRIEPWGPHSIRVRATRLAAFTDLPGALLPQEESEVEITRNVNSVELRNGKLTVRLSYAGRLEFLRSATGEILLEEPLTEILHTSGRKYRHAEGDLEQLEARFLAKEGESFYGLGQHRHGRLDQKGCVIDLVHSNCEIAIPFTLSNRGYGFLWHNPGVGRVELGHTLTRWVADASPQFDYWVTAGDSPKEILRHYAAATGFPPMLPEWAAGFWQCKLRYKNQTEVMEVAREHKRRGLPLSVIVIDFFHWPMMGDLCFDPVDWPDPTAMVEELEKMGIRVMISIWPGFNPNSVNCGPFRDRGYLLRTDRGRDALYPFMDTRPDGEVTMHFYDPTHPEA